MNKEQFLAKWAFDRKYNVDINNFKPQQVLDLMEAWNTHVRDRGEYICSKCHLRQDNFLCVEEVRCETQCLRCIEEPF